MFQPATQATRPSRSARWTLSGPKCPSLRAPGWSTGGICQGIRCFGTRDIPARSRHCCLRHPTLHTQRTLSPLYARVLTCPAGTYLRTLRRARAYRTAVTGSKKHSGCSSQSLYLSLPPAQSTSSPLTTIISAVKARFLPSEQTVGQHTDTHPSGLATGAPNLRRCQPMLPCRSRDADIRTSAASEECPSSLSRNR